MPLALGLGRGLQRSSDAVWWKQGEFANIRLDGDDNSLALDFVNNRYMKGGKNISLADLGLTDTHSSDILALNASGSYDTFAANEIVRNDLGLQVVPSATNLLTQSITFDHADWAKIRNTVAVNSATAPDGTTTADSSIASSDNNNHRIQQTYMTTNTTVYTFSCHFKAAAKTFVYLFTEATSPVAANTTYFNLGNGTVGTTGANHSNAKIINLANGWYRVEITFTGNASGNMFSASFADADNNPVWVGDGSTVDGYLWGAQLETGSFATPPIITTGSPVTVPGNQSVISGLTMNTGVEFCMIADVIDPGKNYTTLIEIGDGGHQNKLSVFHSTGSLRSDVKTLNVAQGNVNTGAWPIGVMGFVNSLTQDYNHASLVGGSAVTDTSVNYPIMTQIGLGGRGVTASENSYLRIKEFYMRTNFTPDATSFAEMLALATARKFASRSTENDMALNFVDDVYTIDGYDVAYPGTSSHSSDLLALNASGTYETFGANEIVRTDLGLQAVPTATNIILNSIDFSAWVQNNAIVTSNTDVAPDGTMTADTVDFTAINSLCRFITSSGDPDGRTFTGSIHLKAGTASEVQVSILGSGSGLGETKQVVTLTDEWQRISLTNTFVGTGDNMRLRLTATEIGSVKVWGGDLVEASFAPPPIITTGTALTAPGNKEVIPDLSMNTGVEGYIVVDVQQPSGTDVEAILTLSDGSTNNRITIYQDNGSFKFQVKASGAVSVGVNLGAASEGIHAFAYSLTTNFAKASLVGGTAQTDTSVTFPVVDRKAFLGYGYTNTINLIGLVKEDFHRTNFIPNDATFNEMLAIAIEKKALYT